VPKGQRVKYGRTWPLATGGRHAAPGEARRGMQTKRDRLLGSADYGTSVSVSFTCDTPSRAAD
jgi:hypothetical protein